MTSFLTLVQVYIAGGLTFLPLVLLTIFVHAYFTLPSVDRSQTAGQRPDDGLRDAADDDKNIVSGVSAIASNLNKDQEKDVAEGYYAVCREYVPGGVNGKPPIRTTPAGEIVAQESPSVYQHMYRSIFERRQTSTFDPSKADGIKSIKRARNIFYVVLRHGHLMLYDDSEQVEVKHVISLAHHDISMFGGGHEIPEGELWIKRNAICLKRKASTLDKGTTASTLPFYFFSENCSDKEDFYFALLRCQDKVRHDGPPTPQVQDFAVKDIISLVQRLHSSEEHLQTRWLNALIGRLFLALYKTKFAEDFVRAKITKKISRVKKPAILSGIVLRSIDLGHAAPLITNPKLRDLNVDGEYCAEAHVSYEGGFRLEIGATARIDLGQRFKAREVTLVLAVVVKRLEGKLLIRLKPPPSNRIWLAFETMPQLDLSVEPVVSSRQITYSIVLRAIESRIREVMAETLVLPNWDDSPFYETLSQMFRGGIWAEQTASNPNDATEIPDEAAEDEAETPTSDLTNLKHADDRTQSMPHLPKQGQNGPSRRDHKTTSSLASLEDKTTPVNVPKVSEKPKVLRASSFASAADPIVSTDNIVGDSVKEPNKKSKPSKDAAGYISELHHRSQPSSPIATPAGRRVEGTDGTDQAGSFSSVSSIMDSMDDRFSISQNSNLSHENDAQSESSKGSPQIRGMRPVSDLPHQTKLQGLAKSLTPSDKKQQAMLAAAAAAKNWGWNTFQKKQRPGTVDALFDKAGTPENPLGRGQPLPPPGMPLPGPDAKRASMLSLNIAKRKAPASQVPRTEQAPQGSKSTSTTREHRRGSSLSEPKIDIPQMLVVEAPNDSGSVSPIDDYGEFMDNVRHEDDHEEILESPIGTHEESTEADYAMSPSRRVASNQSANMYEDEDSHGMASWKIAEEEEARQKNLWMNEHEHEQ